MSGDRFSSSAGIFKFMPRKIKMTTLLLVLILLLLPDERQDGILLVRAENQQEDGVPTLQPSPSPTMLSSNEFAMGIANGECKLVSSNKLIVQSNEQLTCYEFTYILPTKHQTMSF